MKGAKAKFYRIIAVYLVVNFFTIWVFPIASYALTSGPAQPEFSSFEPVATTNMVNEFNGGFTYNLPIINVPGPNGSGYASSLSYHSGATMEEEASWVGFGWTLNPGAINRGKQGLPDDFKNSQIDYTHKVPNSWTAGVGTKAGVEIYSIDFSGSAALRYNNYKGFGTAHSIQLASVDGLASLSFSVSEEGHSFDADINSGKIVTMIGKMKAKKAQKKLDKFLKKGSYHALKNRDEYRSLVAKRNKAEKGSRARKAAEKIHLSTGSQYGLFSLFGTEDAQATTVAGYTGVSVDMDFAIGIDPSFLHLGPEFGISGSFSEQSTENSYHRNAYGYMYSTEWHADDDVKHKLADYRVEKQSPYNKRDKFMPIPYNNPDNFNITGEGIGGSFRMYNRYLGHMRPTHVVSPTVMGNMGMDMSFPINMDVMAFQMGTGLQVVQMKEWNDLGNSNDYRFGNAADESNFFRFSGDMGGNVLYTNDDTPYRASIKNINNVPGVKQYEPEISTTAIPTVLGGRPGRSSYIGYHTNADMAATIKNSAGDDINFRSYTKNNPDDNNDVYDKVAGRSDAELKDRIGEIATYNEDGNRYVYGLPVYAGWERSKSISVKEPKEDLKPVQNKYLVYKNENDDCKTNIGQSSDSRYASSFLLTEITSPDYIDRNFDGPTSDDFGGWTKFNYGRGKSKQGVSQLDPNKSNNASWYQWRFPYTGLFYDKNELCDSRDDMGSYSTGMKEIYFLQTIETKTHIAYFITDQTEMTVINADGGSVVLKGSNAGTTGFRKDGLGASTSASDDASAQNTSQWVEKLEKVVLYAKDANNKIVGKPLKTVHFEYYEDGTDYSLSKVLCKNIPNSAVTYSNGMKAGKLTLHKVWFEYEGITNSKISPYVFNYEYKLPAEFLSTDIKTKYTDVAHPEKDIINYGTGLNQNPDYDIFGSDSWGNYCLNGAARHSNMTPWVDQRALNPSFDPAAWQLKVIKLPSGGEILIQYEQNDYSYVQDQTALGMISLRNANGTIGYKDEKNAESKYYLSLSDAEVDLNKNGTYENGELEAWTGKINLYLGNHKVYFKFLYTLMGDTPPNIDECHVDYISGYMDASAAVDYENRGVFITVTGNGTYKFPRQVCKDYVKREKSGLDISTDCNKDIDAAHASDPLDAVKGLLHKLSTDFTGGTNNCKTMSLENSYLRVPLPKDKKGGGIRVKRVLMHDTGLEPGVNGDESLYGTEYIYKNEDGTSSGVADNEPLNSREENALIQFMEKRRSQSLISKIISGKDKENFEGPIGEELLPTPSIGYARVISKNIHSGKSGTGFRETKYYTSYDYSLSKGTVEPTEIDDHAKDKLFIPAVFVNFFTDNRWVSQGYSFILHKISGQIKSLATYGGTYVDGQSMDSYAMSYKEDYEYFQAGEKVPVMNEDGTITKQYVGKETDVSMEMTSVTDILNNTAFQLDFDIGFLAIYPIPQFSMFGYGNFSDKKMRSHVINKVAVYPAILKKKTVTKDGIVQITENKVFSKSTGQPIVTLVRDGFDQLTLEKSSGVQTGTYTNYNIPASYVYKNMGQMAKNQGYTYNHTSIIVTNSGSGAYNFILPDPSLITNGNIVEGDLIRLSDGTNNKLFYINSFEINLNKVNLKAISWVNSSLTNFITMEVIKSGYTNELNRTAGSIVTYGTSYPDANTLPPSPLTVSGGIIQQASLSKVLSANAETYSDAWGGDNIMDTDYNLSPGGNNEFELGKRGKWRTQSNYEFKSDIKDAFVANNRVYTDAGTYTGFAGFNYYDLASNNANQWLRTNKVNSYSPHGNALEEENILGIRSTSKFGYRESVPVLIAHNAPYDAVLFSGFEDVPGAVNTTAHSGTYSYQMGKNTQYSPGKVYIDYLDAQNNLNNTINTNGLSLKVWVKAPDAYADDIPAYLKCSLLDVSTASFEAKLKKVARVGEWVLLEAKFSNMNYTPSSALNVYIKNTGNFTLWIDDLRVQPSDAQMACYVYDKNNLRLLTSYDDQHFGLFYQYNAEGKLVRKLVETERGMKTVQETQYNIPVE